MTLTKKLIFAPIFLITFAVLIYQINPLLASYNLIFSLSLATLVRLATVAILISLSSFLFALFATLALDWKIVLPVGAVASFLPIIFIDQSLLPVFVVAVLVSLLLSYFSLENVLKSYLTFQPSTILGPSIRHLSGFLILSFCLVYFLSAGKIITKEGFQIPDSLIDTALKMTPVNLSAEQNSTIQELPAISPQQIELLKKNPDLLKQSGLNPKILDTLSQSKSTKPQDLTNDLIKQTVKDQMQNFIKPYLDFIPAILTLLLFLTLQSLTALINILVYPLLWLTFLILEKTGFVRFEVEQRPVKKLVV